MTTEYLKTDYELGRSKYILEGPFFSAPSMGAISRVQVPNDEGSSSHSLRQGCPP